MTDVKVDRYAVEPGIRPLVEAANASGYPTISSCEGHPDGRKAAVVFLASNDEALRTHLGLKDIRVDLLCSWELHARFLYPTDKWVLAWKLENWGVKNKEELGHDDWWAANTEAAQQDVHRLAQLFRELPATLVAR